MSLGLINLFALLVTLGILITVHELGHFLVARWMKVKVLRFSIGFGKPIWLHRGKDGTEYALAAIPLGGYVRMLDEREGDVDPREHHLAFNRQPVGKRIAIVAAGPAFNFAFAIAVYALMFSLGVPATKPLLGDPVADSRAAEAGFQRGDLIVAVDGEPTETLNEVMLRLLDYSLADRQVAITVADEADQRRERQLDLRDTREPAEGGQLLEHLGFQLWPLPAIVGQVVSGSPAAAAGVQSGDRVTAIDGKPIDSWRELVEVVRERPGQPVELRLERTNGTSESVTLTPEAVETETGRIGRMGVGAASNDILTMTVRYGPLEAMWRGVEKTGEMSLFTLRMLGRMIVGQASLDNLSGPLTIAHFAGQAASIGLMAFLSLLALISISLAVLNLLPIPILDGGHLLYYGIELIKGSPVSESVQHVGQNIGFALLLLLMSLALFNDFARLLG